MESEYTQGGDLSKTLVVLFGAVFIIIYLFFGTIVIVLITSSSVVGALVDRGASGFGRVALGGTGAQGHTLLKRSTARSEERGVMLITAR